MKAGTQIIYGFVEAGRLPAKLQGLRDLPVLQVVESGVAAAVTEWDAPQVSFAGEYLRRHEEVLVALASSAAVVPVAFGTLAPTRENVHDFLKLNCEALRQALRRLEGLCGGELKVGWADREGLYSEVLRENTVIRRNRDDMLARRAGGGATLGERIAVGQMVASAVGAKRERDSRRILAELKPICADLKPTLVEQDEQILRAQLLLRLSDLEKFDERISEVDRKTNGRYRFSYRAPLPPYGFCEVALRAA
jgi:hypothetical protein